MARSGAARHATQGLERPRPTPRFAPLIENPLLRYTPAQNRGSTRHETG